MNRGYVWPLWEAGRWAKLCPPPPNLCWQKIKKRMILFGMEANRLYFPVTQGYKLKGMICFGRKVRKLHPPHLPPLPWPHSENFRPLIRMNTTSSYDNRLASSDRRLLEYNDWPIFRSILSVRCKMRCLRRCLFLT